MSKAALFRAAWQAYPNIDYRASSKVTKVDVGARTVTTELGDTVKYDVLNLIPPQRAAAIAVQADLVGADKRWCEVDHVTYESVKAKNVHVIGDSHDRHSRAEVGHGGQRHGQDLRANAVVSLVNGRPGDSDAAHQHVLQLGERPGGHGRHQLRTGSRTARSCRSSRSSHRGSRWRSAERAELGQSIWADVLG